jgi:hypothetical protein
MNFIAILAAAITLQLSPGLSEPVGGDGARVDAAVLVSTNATATANVAAVYNLPVYGTVQTVVTNWTDILTFTTNSVVVTNFSAIAASSNTPYIVSTVYGVATTNYYTVATNSWTSWEPTPVVAGIATNNVLGVTGYKPVTNALFSLTAANGFAETNNVNRCLAPGARLSLTGSAVTIFLR